MRLPDHPCSCLRDIRLCFGCRRAVTISSLLFRDQPYQTVVIVCDVRETNVDQHTPRVNHSGIAGFGTFKILTAHTRLPYLAGSFPTDEGIDQDINLTGAISGIWSISRTGPSVETGRLEHPCTN